MTSMISHDQVGHWPDEAFEFFLRRQIDFKYAESSHLRFYPGELLCEIAELVFPTRWSSNSHHRPSSWCSQWPSAGQVQTARQLGFNILPIGFRHPKKAHENPDHELEWQIAFTKVIITLIEEDSSLPCVSSLKSTIIVWFIDVSITFPLTPNHTGRPRRFLPRGCISPSFGFISLPFSSWKHILRPMTASTSFISGFQINCQTIRVLDRYIDNCNLVGQKIFTNFSGQASPILSCWEKPWRLDRREYWGKVSASNQVWPEF